MSIGPWWITMKKFGGQMSGCRSTKLLPIYRIQTIWLTVSWPAQAQMSGVQQEGDGCMDTHKNKNAAWFTHHFLVGPKKSFRAMHYSSNGCIVLRWNLTLEKCCVDVVVRRHHIDTAQGNDDTWAGAAISPRDPRPNLAAIFTTLQLLSGPQSYTQHLGKTIWRCEAFNLKC